MDSGHLVQPGSPAIREVVPGAHFEFSPPAPPVQTWLPPQESALREYLRVLIKRKWNVLGCLLIIFSVVTIATLKMTPIYRASGSIAINKPDYNLLNFKDSGNAGGEYYDPTDLDTEVNILQSDLLALQVIRTLNLDNMPEFGGKPGSSPSSSLAPDPLQVDSASTAVLLDAFKSGLRVSLKPSTRVVVIEYASTNPQLSATIVNTLAHTYVEQNFKTKFESTMQASDWLTKQLVDLQMKVETSQEKLVKYQKEHEILGTDEKQNIITEKLGELNKALTSAEAARMEKESIYKLVQSGDPDAVASAAGVLDAAGTRGSGGGLSSLLAPLRSKQADLKIQIAELSTQFGPAYPKVAQLNNQLEEIDHQIQLELKKIAERVKGEYMAALQEEQLLSAQFEKQKQEANKLNESAIEYSLLKRDVDTNRALYEGLQEKLKVAGISAGLKSNNIRLVDVARAPKAPTEPNIPRNLAFALVLGLTSGIGLAFLLENMDNTVRTTEQAQVVSGLPALGMIPLGSATGTSSSHLKGLVVAASKEAVELVTISRPQSQMAESYRALRTSLLLSNLGSPPKIILVTSARPQEGKTTTSINVAIVLAQKGVRVLLVDADLRRPSIHKTLGMAPRSGLSNVLTGSTTLEQTISRSPILPNLSILAAGTPPPNPAELLASAQMKDMLDDLREQYDHIVIDTPPTLSVTDAVVLSPRVDSVVLVIRSGKTTKQALRRARDVLMQVNAHVTGVLLNAVDLSSPDYYYYYEYQGKYGDLYYREEEGSPEGQAGSEGTSKPSSESA
jgi:polysaccharide biosynthesis transport protein